jgi:hypothetical protein
MVTILVLVDLPQQYNCSVCEKFMPLKIQVWMIGCSKIQNMTLNGSLMCFWNKNCSWTKQNMHRSVEWHRKTKLTHLFITADYKATD